MKGRILFLFLQFTSAWVCFSHSYIDVVNRDSGVHRNRFGLMIGFQLPQDESFEKGYEGSPLVKYKDVASPRYDFYNTRFFTPTFGLFGSSDFFLFSKLIKLTHTLGFQYYTQEYTRKDYIDVRLDSVDNIVSFDLNVENSLVTKYDLYFRTDGVVKISKHFFAGPILQLDARINHKVVNDSAIIKMGLYNREKDKLLNQSRFNLCAGGVVGVTFFDKLDIGFNVQYGLNKSIHTKPDHNWRVTQGGFFLRLNIIE
ncbi:MAG: hypothetical protein GC181_01430 [Bacteroidetes bacterium]|nr:hypothetical protein [Bacteroidota bacterium]